MLDMATITIEEKDYVLAFPLSAMLKAEKLLGKPLQTMFMTKKDSEGKMVMPDYTLSELLMMFKIGMSTHQPAMSEKELETLFQTFISEGVSLSVQIQVLFMSLGKALGFFRTEIDILQKVKEVLNKKSR